jgi:hypothetical protein
MSKYLPKQWKRQIASSLALFFLLITGVPLMLSIAVVFVEKLWPILLSIAVLMLVGRLLARWRR